MEALKTDKQVKINGLGTFKVQAVAPRKSVNVATGEAIIIEGYNKLTFTPEAGVRELIESGQPTAAGSQPSAASAQTAETDPLKKLGAQAEEIVDILGELAGMDSAVAEPEPVVEPEPEPVNAAPKKPKKETHFMRDTLLCVVILLVLLLLGYFFLRQQLSGIIDSFVQPAQTESVVTDSVSQAMPAEEPIEENAADTLVDLQHYSEFITTEPMHEASRLAWMAKRFYGSKAYWPYLYDANRDVIKNPCLIQVGTPIRVPKLTKEQRDTTDARTAALLEQLRLEAEEACTRN